VNLHSVQIVELISVFDCSFCWSLGRWEVEKIGNGSDFVLIFLICLVPLIHDRRDMREREIRREKRGRGRERERERERRKRDNRVK
jgi:hypothetical protein